MSLHVERGPMVVEDVRALPPEPLVVAEGRRCPRRSCRSIARSGCCRRRSCSGNGSRSVAFRPLRGRCTSCSTRRSRPRRRRHAWTCSSIDGSLGIEETVDKVEHHFAWFLAAEAGATTVEERRELLREANLDVVAQMRGFFARPWASGSAEEVERSFACECGDPACTARIETTVGVAAAGPVLEPRPRALGSVSMSDERAVPILPSRDLDESLAFYSRLGFENRGAPHDRWDYLIIGRGGIELQFYLDPDVDPLLTAANCYLRVHDADALYAEWSLIGVPSDPATGSRLQPPVDTEYGLRELALVDPSGNLLRAGSPIP